MFRELFHFMVLLFYTILPLVALVDPSVDELSSADIERIVMRTFPDDYTRKAAIELIHNDPALRDKLKKRFQLGFRAGFRAGFKAGYKNRSLQYFHEMFGCAIRHGKVNLEVYKNYKEIYSKCEGNQEAMADIKLPADIKDLIEKNDEWIEVYKNKKIFNRYFTTNTNPNTSDEKPSIYRLAYTNWDITKQLRHWYCIVNYTIPENKSNKRTLNKKLPNTTSFVMPPFISKLRNELLEIQRLNPLKYRTTHEIFLRFSALSGRTHKMFSTVHHKLLEHIPETARSNNTVQFTDILFYFVPTWMITAEQLIFFNLVRKTLYPTFPPVRNFSILNTNPEGSEITLIPYDDSKFCNQVIGKKVQMETGTTIHDPFLR